MNTQFTPRPSTRLKGFALAAMLTLAMLVSVDTLATFDAPAAEMALVHGASRG